jgi:hypothetical protein
MKHTTKTILVLLVVAMLTSCSLFRSVFSRNEDKKKGCGTNGKNVGAEKLLSEDPKHASDARAARKAKKFKG